MPKRHCRSRRHGGAHHGRAHHGGAPSPPGYSYTSYTCTSPGDAYTYDPAAHAPAHARAASPLTSPPAAAHVTHAAPAASPSAVELSQRLSPVVGSPEPWH